MRSGSRWMEHSLSYLGNDRGYRRPIVEPRYESSDDMFDGMTYAKGACVLHALRGLLGDDAWWKGIRAYVADHKFQVVETDDFRKAMETASGKDLNWFFDQWVYKAGHPELKVRWHYEDADKTVRLKVEQTQTLDDQTPLFRLPTTLEIADGLGKTRVVPIVIDGASHEFVIPAAARPKMVQIDPEGWLIKELDFEKSPEENRFQLEHAACVLGRLDRREGAGEDGQGPACSRHCPGSGLEAGKSTPRQERNRRAHGQRRRDLSRRLDRCGRRLRSARSCRRTRRAGQAQARRPRLRHSCARPGPIPGKPTARAGPRLRGLVAWKVKDADVLLAAALKIPADHHSIATTALKLMLETPGPKARELAVLYSRYGQPAALRSAAIEKFQALAKDDVALQDILVTLVSDRDQNVRHQTWGVVRALEVTQAYPALKAQLAHETSGFSGICPSHA